jgi:hypothetical protein
MIVSGYGFGSKTKKQLFFKTQTNQLLKQSRKTSLKGYVATGMGMAARKEVSIHNAYWEFSFQKKSELVILFP